MKKFIRSNGKLKSGASFGVALFLSLSFFGVNEVQAQVPTDAASFTVNATTGKASYMVLPANASFLDNQEAIVSLKTGISSVAGAQPISAQEEAYAGAQLEYFSYMLDRVGAGASVEEAYLNSYNALFNSTAKYDEGLSLDMNQVRQNLLALITQ